MSLYTLPNPSGGPPITVAVVHQMLPSGRPPKLHYMERTLENGEVIRHTVVNENAVNALLLNGFKRSYPEPGEVVSIETDPADTRHVICRPSPLLPLIKGLTPEILAAFIQPGDDAIARCHQELYRRQIARNRIPTRKEYEAALKLNLNPLLNLRKEEERKTKEEKKLTKKSHKKMPRGKFPSQKSVLEKIMLDAERDAVKRRPSSQARFPSQAFPMGRIW
ncbi:hypothetical protein CRE_14744 [Caenorhabditis remanei]|uniref:Uncharacterized protein n=1 Tax=Caenorhabditis remanei TaxID=31234 RepID=E3MRP5_CAERE|nr:hypothetical protein CRE_14744 [Caenorhabditis remanei]